MNDLDRKIAAKTLRDFVADQDDMREAFDSIQGSGITPVELVTYRAIRQAERIEAGEPDLAHDRKIAARAWEEGWDACMGYVDGPDWGQVPLNPYLEGSNNDCPYTHDLVCRMAVPSKAYTRRCS